MDDVTQMCHVTVPGELDLHTVRTLLPVLDEAAATGAPVIVDGTDLTFLDSTALSHLHRHHQAAVQRGVPFVLAVQHPAVLKLLRITGLADVIPVFADLDAATTHVRFNNDS